MLRHIFKAFMLLFLATAAHSQVQVSGHLLDPSGTAIPNSFVRFQLTGCNGMQPRVDGFGMLGRTYKDFIPNSSTGLITGNIYANDSITCGSGSARPTLWMVTFNTGSTAAPGLNCYNITSTQGPFNLDTAAPVACKTQ